jgi:polysaccharide biosynthesis/export protein
MWKQCGSVRAVAIWAVLATCLVNTGCVLHMAFGQDEEKGGACSDGGSCASCNRTGGNLRDQVRAHVCGTCCSSAVEHRKPHDGLPIEQDKVSLPCYIIEPPDILLIDLVKGTPLPPYRIEPLDSLQIYVPDALPNEPIAGIFVVEPEGTVNLGLSYGSIRVAGMTLEQARVAIVTQLKRVLKDPRPVVALAQVRNLQQLVRGEHLVRPDGTITLGVYGDVYVAGLSRQQARAKIEEYLGHCLQCPQISLDIIGYNSKVYYVIYDGGGYGQQIYRLPITGNETVLDAISQLNGLPAVSSTKKMWLARPAPPELGCDQVLPIDWRAITEGGSTVTNYQVLPGDRIFVKADCLIATDNWLAKFLQPIERVFGAVLLGEITVQSFRNNRNNNNIGTFGVF